MNHRASTLALVLLMASCSSEPPPPAHNADSPTSASADVHSATSAAASATAAEPVASVEVPPPPPNTATATATAAASTGGVTKIELRFRDSSVPPQYHRSYTITLTPRKARKVVDSYGDVISDEEAALDPKLFEKLVADLKKLGLKDVPPKSDGCTGGTSRSLTVYEGSNKTVQVASAKCGGKETGSLAAASAWIAEVENAAPDSKALKPSKPAKP